MVAKSKSSKRWGSSSKTTFSIATLVCGAGANRPRPPLIEVILNCDWVELHNYLVTGSFQDADNNYGDSTTLPELQAQKWTTYQDSYTNQKVRQLALHAAISHLAPLVIVQMILHLNEEAAQLADNNGNLPLHLAFTTNAKDVSSFLLKVYPDALMVANEAGNLPIECYHHIGRSIITAASDSDDNGDDNSQPREQSTKASRGDDELRLLERNVAKDEHRIAAAAFELQDIKKEFRRIQQQLTDQQYSTGTVEL